MLKNVQITLYEIFGYFLPGVVALISIGLLFWSLFYPDTSLVIKRQPFEFWFGAGLIAYFLGHLTHALADRIFGRPENKALDELPSATTPENIPELLREKAREQAGHIMDISPKNINNSLLFSICDEILAQSGEIGDREIYQYRGGFYKATAISLTVLAIAGLIRVFQTTTLNIEGSIRVVSRGEVVFGLLVIMSAAFFYWRKYIWFAKHRVRRAVLGFMIVQNGKARTSVVSDTAHD